MTGGAGLPAARSGGEAAGLSSSMLGGIGDWAVFRASACATRFSSSMLELALRLVTPAWSSCAMYLCGGPAHGQTHHLHEALLLQARIRWQQLHLQHGLLACTHTTRRWH